MKNDLKRLPLVEWIPLQQGKRSLRRFALKGLDGLTAREYLQISNAIHIWEPNKTDMDRALIFCLCELGYSVEAVLEFYKRRSNKLNGSHKYIADLYSEAYESLYDAEVALDRRTKSKSPQGTYGDDNVPAILALLHFLRIMVETEDPIIVNALQEKKNPKLYYQINSNNPDNLYISVKNCSALVAAYGSRENILWPDLGRIYRSLAKARRAQEPWLIGRYKLDYMRYGKKRTFRAYRLVRRLLIHMGYWTENDSLVKDILFAKTED